MDNSVIYRLALMVALAGFFPSVCFGALPAACHGQTGGNGQTWLQEPTTSPPQTDRQEPTQPKNPDQQTELRPVSKPPMPTPDLKQVIDSEHQFALELVRAIAPVRQANFVISPYGVFECLNLVKDAGSPQVDTEISQALGLQPSKLYAKELAGLGGSFDLTRPTNIEKAPANPDGKPSPVPQSPTEPVEVLKSFVTKTIMVQDNRLKMVPEARQQLFDPFSVDIISWDKSAPDAAEKLKNSVDQIFSNATSGRLTELGYSPPAKDTVLGLVNLCFFDGLWLKPFVPSASKDAPFVTGYDAGGIPTETKARFVCDDSRRAFYFENDAFQLVELPYRDSMLSMVLVLPGPETTLAETFNSLTQSKCLGDRAQSPRQIETVNLEIPKFSFKTKGIDLESLCVAVGISSVFTPEAGFEKLFATTTPIGVGSARQDAFVEVNEKGTRAAAITDMNMIPMSAPPKSEKSFVANRPFLFFVTDTRGVILFAGRVSDPTSTE